MNIRLKSIFNEDQKDRRNPVVFDDPKLFIKRDKSRRNQVNKLLLENKVISPKDYFMAAMIFHHGSSIQDVKKAIVLAKKSGELGYKRGLSLYAMAIDRLLIRQNKKQKFGTQYRKKDSKSSWRLLPYDSNTTDQERRKYHLMTIPEMKKHLTRLNNKEQT